MQHLTMRHYLPAVSIKAVSLGMLTVTCTILFVISIARRGPLRLSQPPPFASRDTGDLGHGDTSRSLASLSTLLVGQQQAATSVAATKEASSATVFDLSFPGFPGICKDNLPTAGGLMAMTADEGRVVEMTHTSCCEDVSSSGRLDGSSKMFCRSAPQPLRVPLLLARAALESGGGVADLERLDLLQSLVFITGASANHYIESLVLLKSLQTFFPNNRVLYWDLGLTAEQAAAVQTVCGVSYRWFNASKYPAHVATLTTYAFKPLVIMESFTESHPILWWVDSSIRFTTSNIGHVLALMKERHGFVAFRDYNHSVYSATYPGMYDYLATSAESLKQAATAMGGSIILANTKELFSTVLFWYYTCALDRRCIAPTMNRENCELTTFDRFANCHRFDQSLLTILLTNVWGYHTDGYRFAQDMFDISRTHDGDKNVRICPG